MIGKVLGGRYELLEEIGKGGMAYVYKARCVLLNRIVAVKILRDDLGDDEEFLKRFNAEAQAAASLDHQNIVSIFDVGVDDNHHYITMEYVDGKTLKEYIAQKGRLPYKEALGIAAQICDAIEAAHNKNIVHRDIKPHNILITDDGMVKVADFGIARFGTGKTLSNGNDILGSVHYISPEQAKGIPVDNRSDIYSLGVVMYEMLSGRLPFESDNPVSVAMMQIEDSPLDIVSIVPEIPISCQHIVFKAMSKDPDLRYQTAQEFKTDIVNVYNNPNVIIDKRFLYKNLNTEPQNEKNAKLPPPPAKKSVKILMVLLAMVSSFVLVFGGYALIKANPLKAVSAIFSSSPKRVEVPSLTGKSLDEAQKICNELGLTIAVEDEVEDDTKDNNTVVSQSLSKGSMADEGSIIDVVVTIQSQQFELKDYVGQDYATVQKRLEKANLQVSIIVEESDREKDNVIDQSPKAGSVLKSGARVTLYVSGGKSKTDDLIKVPSVVGKKYSAAKAALESAGLKIGGTVGALNPSANDLVIDQSIPEGSMVKQGCKITLTVEIDITESSDNNSSQTNQNTGTSTNNDSLNTSEDDA